jgi:hypothetical protein
MLRGLVAFGLSRQPIILLGLLLFAGAGLIAFRWLNIEAYPNPAPVILEITAQAPGLSAEEMEAVLHDPQGGRIGLHAGGLDHPLDLVLRPLIRARNIQVRHRLLFCGDPGKHLSAANGGHSLRDRRG